MWTKGLGYRQDTAPRGGFGEITWKRNALARGAMGLRGLVLLTGFCASNGYIYVKVMYFRHEMEWMERSSRFAITGLLQAESDRMTLRRAKHNEDAEAAIMADVPGWIPGASVMHDNAYYDGNLHRRRDYARLYKEKGAYTRYREDMWELPYADIY